MLSGVSHIRLGPLISQMAMPPGGDPLFLTIHARLHTPGFRRASSEQGRNWRRSHAERARRRLQRPHELPSCACAQASGLPARSEVWRYPSNLGTAAAAHPHFALRCRYGVRRPAQALSGGRAKTARLAAVPVLVAFHGPSPPSWC